MQNPASQPEPATPPIPMPVPEVKPAEPTQPPAKASGTNEVPFQGKDKTENNAQILNKAGHKNA